MQHARGISIAAGGKRLGLLATLVVLFLWKHQFTESGEPVHYPMLKRDHSPSGGSRVNL
jgi:hypothetical protein